MKASDVMEKIRMGCTFETLEIYSNSFSTLNYRIKDLNLQ